MLQKIEQHQFKQTILDRIESCGESLSFSSNSLHRMSLAQCEQFKEALSKKAPLIKHLDLSNIDFSNFHSVARKLRSNSIAQNPPLEETRRLYRTFFESIQQCVNLESLKLANCQLDTFSYLSLDECTETGLFSETITKFKKLKMLDLSNNIFHADRGVLTEDIFKSLPETQLEVIDLSNCKIWAAKKNQLSVPLIQEREKKMKEPPALVVTIFCYLRKCSRLKEINLARNLFTSSLQIDQEYSVDQLTRIPTLEKIDLTFNGLMSYGQGAQPVPNYVKAIFEKLNIKLVHDCLFFDEAFMFNLCFSQEKYEEALEAARRIPLKNPKSSEIRFEAFQFLFTFIYNKTNSHKEAFSYASEFCIVDGKLISMSDQQLKVFDAYVSACLNKNLAPDTILSYEERQSYLAAAIKIAERIKSFEEGNNKYNGLINATALVKKSKEKGITIFFEKGDIRKFSSDDMLIVTHNFTNLLV